MLKWVHRYSIHYIIKNSKVNWIIPNVKFAMLCVSEAETTRAGMSVYMTSPNQHVFIVRHINIILYIFQ